MTIGFYSEKSDEKLEIGIIESHVKINSIYLT